MREEWKPIPEFDNYSVSDMGSVRNEDTGRMMAKLRNQTGIVNVGLSKAGVQYKRALAVLVAEAFVPREGARLTFTTPMHRDGDRTNCRAENLLWRPRWFAARYHAQFDNGLRGFRVPIRDITTGEEFANSWEAAMKYGLIDREILEATLNRTYVWPTYQKFEVIDDPDIKSQ